MKKTKDEKKEQLNKFVDAYCSPNSSTRHSIYRSMLYAGFSESMARKGRYRYEPEVDEAIKKQDEQYKMVISDAFKEVVLLKKATLKRDIKDYLKTETIKDENGQERQIQILVPVDELTEEQRQQIENLDYKGARGVPGYTFLSKDQAARDICSLYDKYCTDVKPENTNETEVILENIKDTVNAKIKIIQKNDKLAATAGDFIQQPKNLSEED